MCGTFVVAGSADDGITLQSISPLQLKQALEHFTPTLPLAQFEQVLRSHPLGPEWIANGSRRNYDASLRGRSAVSGDAVTPISGYYAREYNQMATDEHTSNSCSYRRAGNGVHQRPQRHSVTDG
jgi:hypothetical protein